MKKIAIGIPTLNEEDTIVNTATIIDNGLVANFDPRQCFIVNIDNNSLDSTKHNFLFSRTSCNKVYISSELGKKGKGLNLRNFFRFCHDYQIDYAATIDSDISTLSVDWIDRLLKPIIEEKADYVTPLYTRSRFEGSTTNHFAYPFIYTFFGKNIRQPIGGEFSFNRSFINYCLNKSLTTESEQYGIDIFLTTHALGGNFNVREVFLGQKFHKPSFPKIVPMFKQVFASAVQVLSSYEIRKNPVGESLNKQKICIDVNNDFKHQNRITELVNLSKEQLIKNKGFYSNSDLASLKAISEKALFGLPISADDWSETLSKFFFLAKIGKEYTPTKLAEFIAPIFFLRTVAFWSEIINKKPTEIELMLTDQADLIRQKTWEYLPRDRKNKKQCKVSTD